jgi:hypothetical protein
MLSKKRANYRLEGKGKRRKEMGDMRAKREFWRSYHTHTIEPRIHFRVVHCLNEDERTDDRTHAGLQSNGRTMEGKRLSVANGMRGGLLAR